MVGNSPKRIVYPLTGVNCSRLVVAIGSDLGRFAVTDTVASRPVDDGRSPHLFAVKL